ncbi:hypothetical protein [Arthrobacter castelli]|uniref:hypothetical protein n=1 Tax=Arthrobacter castelli TaxID=271431 RepID=UPI000423B320|nr:hypothetical protein [Arthrobacter castelli]
MEPQICITGATYTGSLTRYHGYTAGWLTDCSCSDCILLDHHNPDRRVDVLVTNHTESMFLHHARRTSFTPEATSSHHDKRTAA